MAYSNKTWVNRQTEYPTRRLLTATGTANVYDVSREEGIITAAGDAFSATNMNDLESRVSDALDEITGSFTHSLTTTVHALTGTFPVSSGITTMQFNPTADYTSGDTFTVNGTAYTATMQNGDALNTDTFVTGLPLSVNVDLTNHKLVFKSGGIPELTGTATADYVASGLTFYSTDAKTKLTGTGAAAKRYASGSSVFSLSSSDSTITLNVSGLAFAPSTVIGHCIQPSSSFTGKYLVAITKTGFKMCNFMVHDSRDNSYGGYENYDCYSGIQSSIYGNSFILVFRRYVLIEGTATFYWEAYE